MAALDHATACVRLDKDCKITPPKRQKDRVVELEAQVERLRKLLEAQNIRPPSPDSGKTGDGDPQPAPRSALALKKRKLDEEASQEDELSSNPIDWFARLDAIVLPAKQSELLHRCTGEMFPYFPLVSIDGKQDYASMRDERPLLLHAIIYATCPAVLDFDSQESIAKLMFDILAKAVIEDHQKSVEILQALQVIYLWYRALKSHTYGGYVSVFDLVQLASNMAEELGLRGPVQPVDSKASWTKQRKDLDNEAAWRTWMVCRILSTLLCVFTRQSYNLEWIEQDEISLQMLDYRKAGGESSRLVCHIAKAERLTERIAAESGCYDVETVIGFADPVGQPARIALQSAVLDFESQILPAQISPLTTFWRHVVTLQLHEPVLHTATNKRSFTAPYLAERLSVTDFQRQPSVQIISPLSKPFDLPCMAFSTSSWASMSRQS